MHRWAILRSLVLVLFIACFANPPVTAKSIDSVNQPPRSAHAALVEPAFTPADLIQQADLVVRGRVLSSQSAWDADHRLIESAVTVQVAYTLLGHAGTTVTLRTPGGYLAEEGLGMVSMHAANFAPGEDVLLFLQQGETDWQTINGAAGKFLVQGDQLLQPDGAYMLPLDETVAGLMAYAADTGEGSPFATLWQQADKRRGRQPTLPLVYQSGGEVHKWPAPHAMATYYVNINSVQVATASGERRAALRDAIIAAADQWSAVQNADFTLRYGGPAQATTTGYNGVNEILFMAKGPTERAAAAEVWYRADGVIVEADIWINDDYRWDTTGTPTTDELDLQSALQHEFGHWLILGHMPDRTSVMYPRLARGSVKRVLQAEDIAGISTIYPR